MKYSVRREQKINTVFCVMWVKKPMNKDEKINRKEEKNQKKSFHFI